MLNPLRDAQAMEPVCRCDNCDGEMYSGETMYCMEGKWLCLDCFRDVIRNMAEFHPDQLALELDLDMKGV